MPLKSFTDGEAILADDTNGNNQYILNQITSSLNAFRTEIQALIAGSVLPAGIIAVWPYSNTPAGWLKCDGSILSRTDYADLFSAIGTTYGSTDSTNFKLPDFQGAFLRGYGGNSATLGTKQESAAPNITGEMYTTTGTMLGISTGAVRSSSRSASYAYTQAAISPSGVTFDASRCSSVYQNSIDEIRPDNYSVNWIIKY